MKPEDYLRLVQSGLDAQQIALVMEILGTQERAYAEKDEERRDKARTRVQKWREKQVKTQRNVTEHNVTQRNGLREGVTRVEDNLQGKDISGKEGRKEASPSARPSRGTRIPDDFHPDIEAAVAEGVPRLEAERQARSFCDYWRAKPGKDGLKLDWPATWRVWYRRNIATAPPQQKSASPPRRQNAFEAYDEIARLKGWKNEPGIISSTDEDVQCVSAVGERPSGVVVDLRRGHDWRS